MTVIIVGTCEMFSMAYFYNLAGGSWLKQMHVVLRVPQQPLTMNINHKRAHPTLLL